MKVGFVSLGCSKNLVDTEMMIGLFEKQNFEIVNQPEEAEMMIVNTCGFIESAKKEAIQTILEMADYKKQQCHFLIVTGCLVERYLEELKEELPEVDLWIPVREYDHFWEKIAELLSQQEKELPTLQYKNRKISTSGYYAYLKIAEGCSNHCTYCAIPKIRGPYVSRKEEDILEEAQKLSDAGVQEIIVIAQDTTKYGVDLYGEPRLASLLRKLCQMNFHWVRFLYAYPESITPALIQAVKEEDKICSYFDIPIQHISDAVLKRMGRRTNRKAICDVIQTIRTEIPDAVIRTTLIAGFPGETEEQFQELKEFVKETKFDRLGCFAYSKEDGTPAEKLDGQLPKRVKEARAKEIMKLQQIVSKETHQDLVGKQLEVMLESITEDGAYYIGRSAREVPEDTDGFVFVRKEKECIIGDFIPVVVEKALEYDVIAKML